MKLINTNIIRRSIELNKSIDFCPVCKDNNIKIENGVSKCYSCETIFGMTKCNDSNCNHNFAWVKPPIKYLDTNECNNLDKLLKKEQMLGINSITNFEIRPKEEKSIPICPNCGGSFDLQKNLTLEIS